nr:MAG TPA: hypothetical protein [Caudoviricetes sp.]
MKKVAMLCTLLHAQDAGLSLTRTCTNALRVN